MNVFEVSRDFLNHFVTQRARAIVLLWLSCFFFQSFLATISMSLVGEEFVAMGTLVAEAFVSAEMDPDKPAALATVAAVWNGVQMNPF